jgi:hypothetical protein
MPPYEGHRADDVIVKSPLPSPVSARMAAATTTTTTASPTASASTSPKSKKSSSSSSPSTSSSSKRVDLAQIAYRAAQKVEHDFDQRSTLLLSTRRKGDGAPTKLVAFLSSDELLLSSAGVFDDETEREESVQEDDKNGNHHKKKKTHSQNQPYLISHLKGVSLNSQDDNEMDDDMEDTRERFAERSKNEGYFAVKFVNPSMFSVEKADLTSEAPNRAEKRKKRLKEIASSLVLECKILSDLDKHPNVSQIYATCAKGSKAGFGHRVLEDNFFIVTDEIKETLQDRIQSWRKKESYEAERFDDQERRSRCCIGINILIQSKIGVPARSNKGRFRRADGSGQIVFIWYSIRGW